MALGFNWVVLSPPAIAEPTKRSLNPCLGSATNGIAFVKESLSRLTVSVIIVLDAKMGLAERDVPPE